MFLTVFSLLILAFGMHTLHFGKALKVKPLAADLVQRVHKFKACNRVHKAFVENISRANGLILMPSHAFVTGKDWQKCLFAASDKLFDGKKPTDEQYAKHKNELRDLAVNLRNQISVNRTFESFADDLQVASSNIEVFAKNIPVVHGILHDILKSSLIQAWGAYEVLADDLFQCVDAKRPHLRASWTGSERGKSGFLSRSRIANAYRFTFRKDNAAILSVVDDPAVHALGIVRNVLVHGAGLIDPIFKDDRKDCPKQLAQIRGREIGYEIKFTGDFVRFLIDPVVLQSLNLVKAVDEWLIRNP